MDLTVVIPLFNEEESLPELTSWIKKVVDEEGYSYEILLIDDGSKDASWKIVEEINKQNPNVKGIKFRRNYGKSAALNVGFAAAQGDVVITMDADLQDSPDEIPILFNRIKNENLDLISGWKKKRFDPLTKTIPTKLFNYVTQRMSGIKNLHDFNCGLKAYKKEVVKSIEVYGEMHRYIPVLAKWAGFTKIEEQVVQHQARKYGVTKFGFERFINGFLDLLSIFFVGKFKNAPMHFFGTLGTLMFMFGLLSVGYIFGEKFYLLYIVSQEATLVTNSPFFYLALVMMILGVQLFLAGFLGELISRASSSRNVYHVSDSCGVEYPHG